jgi:protein-S-isoprenylcysteine O-methyltransferase Ste14
MLAEEKLLSARYPGYAAYAGRTARIIPFIF